MKNLSKSTLLGLVLILVGIVLVLTNTDVLPWQFKYYVLQWENILIVIGAYLLLSEENEKAGGILLAIGIFFVMDDWFRVSIWELWPLGLVFIGVFIIRQRATSESDISIEESDSLLEDTAIFGGGDRVFTTQNFKKGNFTAIFGGANLDLTCANISGGVAEIEIFYMFGGSKIRIPKHWSVEFRSANIFGGLSDKRIITDLNHEDQPRLIIKGITLFGGAEITN